MLMRGMSKAFLSLIFLYREIVQYVFMKEVQDNLRYLVLILLFLCAFANIIHIVILFIVVILFDCDSFFLSCYALIIWTLGFEILAKRTSSWAPPLRAWLNPRFHYPAGPSSWAPWRVFAFSAAAFSSYEILKRRLIFVFKILAIKK